MRILGSNYIYPRFLIRRDNREDTLLFKNIVLAPVDCQPPTRVKNESDLEYGSHTGSALFSSDSE